MCGGIPYIVGYDVTLFIPKIGSKIDCVVYTGLYNFMKEIPVYIFRREKITVYIDLRCFIIDQSWRLCDSVMQLVHKPVASVV